LRVLLKALELLLEVVSRSWRDRLKRKYCSISFLKLRYRTWF
jgi:hypothetical protein